MIGGGGYSEPQYITQGYTYSGATTSFIQPAIQWVQQNPTPFSDAPYPAKVEDDDPITWLRNRVQETIDEVEWADKKAA